MATAALALALLGRAEPARERMAVALKPGRSDWRNDLVAWLIGWGKLGEAHEQAVVGLYDAPGDPGARREAAAAAEALARGILGPTPGTPQSRTPCVRRPPPIILFNAVGREPS